MLEIDGSMGEGGGSILRISLALAALKSEPTRIYNIRAKRSKPGLSNQHLKAVKALKEITDAKVEGLKLRSTKVIFRPEALRGGGIQVDIGTAGSTTLILQALMIPAAFAEDKVKAEIIGGTDNPFAPPIDYLKNITLPILKKMGYRGNVDIKKRGHYPKGGGKILAEIDPIDKLQPLTLTDPGKVEKVSGRSHCVKLPGHIAERQAESAEKALREKGYDANVAVESYEKSEDPHLSPGSAIVLWARTENGAILGTSALGKKGKPAEKVGVEAAEDLIEQLLTKKATDRYLTDQLVPYLALASGRSEITSAEITSHTLTNLKLVEKILGSETMVEGNEGSPGKIFLK